MEVAAEAAPAEAKEDPIMMTEEELHRTEPPEEIRKEEGHPPEGIRKEEEHPPEEDMMTGIVAPTIEAEVLTTEAEDHPIGTVVGKNINFFKNVALLLYLIMYTDHCKQETAHLKGFII